MLLISFMSFGEPERLASSQRAPVAPRLSDILILSNFSELFMVFISKNPYYGQ